MNHTNFLEHNKLSYLHNNKTIFFCKTDYLNADFKYISTLNNDVILISGNSDYPITDDIVNRAPKNIKKWYAINCLTHHPIVEPIPLGLENQYFSVRDGHGIAYPERANNKEKILKNLNTKHIPSKFLYCNFTISTNPIYRQLVYDTAKQTNHTTIDNPVLDLNTMFDRIKDHKMVLCPAGNGIDSHRLWETLYCNRIPVTFNINNYAIYKLYKQLPIIILDSIKDILDFNLINNKYKEMITRQYDLNLLNTDYWIDRIKNNA